jgi:hypothetical protein
MRHDEHREATLSTTVPASPGHSFARAVAPQRVRRLAVTALFAAMAGLLLAAVLVALLAGPEPSTTPRPAPAPAVHR